MEETGSLSPLSFGLLAVALMATGIVPRRWVLAPVVISTTLMTIGQSLYIAGANFYFLRIVIIAAWIRLLVKQETRPIEYNRLDKAFLLWVCFAVLVSYIPKEIHPNAVMPPATFLSNTINKGGFVLDAVGAYFLARQVCIDSKDIARVVQIFVVSQSS